MRAIVYSLFGYERGRQANCFDFNSYLRGLMINIRLAKLIYPEWKIILETDQATYDAWNGLFNNIPIEVHVNENGVPLTKAMLWRLKPAFEMHEGKWKYSHILCRDLDSPLTYREAQAVYYWIQKDKAVHAITDSVSHGIPLLGGMIGVKPDYFNMRMGVNDWNGLIALGGDLPYGTKGADQTFLNRIVYPRVGKHGEDSITQHYVKGMPHTFLTDCHAEIQDIPIGVSEDLKESNLVCGHIGAAGWYETELFRFLRKYWDKFSHILMVEKNFPQIFYWTNEN